TAIWYGLVISFLLIVTRMLCTLGASLFTKVMSNFITVADPNPGWKGPLVIGWAGMRGVVSLAAALSIPLVINQGQPFPYRNLILFITFIVILVTLVFQGLTLPWLIRKIRLEDKYQVIPEEEQEIIIQKKIATASLQLLEEKYGKDREQNQHLKQLFSKFQTDIDFFDGDEKTTDSNTLRSYQHIYLELLEQQRTLLNKMNARSEFAEDVIRKYLSLIDLEELKLRGKIQ
ncbi:MAG: sodium:hydrogen antiporter, partial [Segetibacter sp.]|nr:sodium:hydrogen antiporter [Segetibacter sp.]